MDNAGSFSVEHLSTGRTIANSIGGIHHIHGRPDSQIIMGVNDESQLNVDGGVEPL